MMTTSRTYPSRNTNKGLKLCKGWHQRRFKPRIAEEFKLFNIISTFHIRYESIVNFESI